MRVLNRMKIEFINNSYQYSIRNVFIRNLTLNPYHDFLKIQINLSKLVKKNVLIFKPPALVQIKPALYLSVKLGSMHATKYYKQKLQRKRFKNPYFLESI